MDQNQWDSWEGEVCLVFLLAWIYLINTVENSELHVCFKIYILKKLMRRRSGKRVAMEIYIFLCKVCDCFPWVV